MSDVTSTAIVQLPVDVSMGEFRDRTVCVVDNGLFTELAVTLSKSFGTVYYLSSWETSFPRSNAVVVGEGVPGITRISSIWPVLNEIDLFVFPDIYHGPLQVYLRGLGKRVWGSGLVESLEIHRAKFKGWLKDLGLPVGPYRTIKGIPELRRHLQQHEGVYVKSETRGDMETFRSLSYRLIEPRLDKLQHDLGAKQSTYEFVVEEHIESDVEIGYDGFTIDGKFPEYSLFGVEVKDQAYLGEVRQSPDLPKALPFINNRLSRLFKALNYRGFWSSEIRMAGVPYLIDPCCRMASPPGELYQYLISNLAEVMWAGANGELVEPEWRHKWGAEIIIRSEWAEDGWQSFEIPKEVREHVKIHYLADMGGVPYCVPQQIPIPEVGAIVAGGDTAEEAIKAATEIAEKVRGYDLVFHVDALGKAKEGMSKL